MKNNSQTIEKTSEKQVVRPLNVLVKLIKEDLVQRKKIRDNASTWIETEIGEKLIEAKSQLGHGKWGKWLESNFHLSQATASIYMKAARQFELGMRPKTLNEVRGDKRKFGHPPTWVQDARETAQQARQQMDNFLQAERDRAAERDAERKLGLQMIDIGFKALSKELHPDKMGGSKEAMQRLNAERDRLKAAA